MIDNSNYYCRWIEEIENRIDFVYYHPELDPIKSFRNSDVSFPFLDLVITSGVDYGVTESGKDEGHYAFVNIQNLSDRGLIDRSNIKYIDTAPDDKLLDEKQVLISRSRLVGRAAKVTNEFKGATFGSYIIRFELKKDIDYEIDFLVKYINSRFGQQQITLLKTGASGENINSSQLLDIRLPKIGKGSQKEILRNLASIESQAENLEHAASNILIKAEEVFLSKLGISLPTEFKRIDYYTRFPDKLSRLDFVFNNQRYDLVEKLISESSSKFIELSDVAYFLQDSRNPTESPNEQFIYADIGNIDTRWGIINPVTMYGRDAKSSRMRRVMYAGTVLVSTTRPTRNAITIVPEELDNQICSTGLAVLRCKDNMDNRFLFHALRTRLTNLQFEKYCSGSGYPAITQEVDLPKIKVPLPPTINAQVRIVNEIENLLEEAKEKEREAKLKWQKTIDMFERQFEEQKGKEVPLAARMTDYL